MSIFHLPDFFLPQRTQRGAENSFLPRMGHRFKVVGEYTHPTFVLAFLASWRFNFFSLAEGRP
jgi:hypothetical protein